MVERVQSISDDLNCLRRQLAAARAVVEAARRVVDAKHDVDPVDVYYLREAIRRYDERCEGGSVREFTDRVYELRRRLEEARGYMGALAGWAEEYGEELLEMVLDLDRRLAYYEPDVCVKRCSACHEGENDDSGTEEAGLS